MTKVIDRNLWKNFFDDLSLQFTGWETRVEMISDEMGAQRMSGGLPFGGITLEERDGNWRIELLLRVGTENHQSHVITDPVAVVYETETSRIGGVLDIEDKAGVKTLIQFVQPGPMLAEDRSAEILAVAS
jgi:hypothetical protein